MKKLDKLIIKSFIGPFVATFFITLFVLVMQFFWLWIDDFVGKGLDAGTIMKFIWYQSAVLIPLALPLAVLLSSLMTFGNLGETFELVAIKSAGISLLRFMQPLMAVTLVISFLAFLFNNYAIPVAQLKSRTLLADIVLAKPAFDIKEGVFYDKLDRFAIKIGKKEPNDSIIKDVVVFESSNNLQDNFLVAKSGIMKPSPDKRFLDIIFKDGWRYQERGGNSDSATEYIRLGFKEYKMQLDISTFSFKASADSANKNNERVLSMRQLDVAIDSMNKFNKGDRERYKNSMLGNFSLLQFKDSITKGIIIPDSVLNFKKNRNVFLGIDSLPKKTKDIIIPKPKKADTVVFAKPLNSKKKRGRRNRNLPTDAIPARASIRVNNQIDSIKKSINDSVKPTTTNVPIIKHDKKDANNFVALIPDSARVNINDRAQSSISIVKDNANMTLSTILDQEKNIRRYKIEWHKKVVLALACFLMFMIGAPLGSIIRKGGLGTPMIFAIAFFLVFYFSSNTGEKMAKEGSLTPFQGMWLSSFVLAPIGTFLTYKAMRDSNLFNKEFYNRFKRKMQVKMKNHRAMKAKHKI